MSREISIDALRGIAIIGMVLSGTIAHHPDLPGWMFHAQVGPPDFTFHPERPGITWVDLVFPFFLFAMGLAIPFSLNPLIERDPSKRGILRKIVFRTAKLFLFALLLPHFSPWGIPQEEGIARWIFSLGGFLLFFMSFSRFPRWKKWERWLNGSGYLLLFGAILIRGWAFHLPFSVHSNDIIILVLANMALFAAIIWLFTSKNWWPRVAILAFYLALRLTAGTESVNTWIYHFTPLNFLGDAFPLLKESLESIGVYTGKTLFYSMYFLKYLFIVIPGTMAGDLLYRQYRTAGISDFSGSNRKGMNTLMIVLLLAFVLVNLIGLYTREEILLWCCNLLLLGIILFFIGRRKFHLPKEWHSILQWSLCWLFLGLVFEPYEGGIKKDVATLSYFFITSGLSGMVLLAFRILQDRWLFQRYFGFVAVIGQNPMAGYVAVSYCIIPVLALGGIMEFIDSWTGLHPWLGVLRGLVLTILMILLTAWTVKQKLYWKT